LPGELQIRALCVTDCKSVTSKREMCNFHVKRSIKADFLNLVMVTSDGALKYVCQKENIAVYDPEL